LSTLTEWLGDGGLSVPNEQAQQRAVICLKCPMNRKATIMEALGKTPVALAIRRTLELKEQLEMRVAWETKLHVCAVCKCCLPLKVHVPLDYILRGSTMEEIVEFEKVNCWITRERKSS